MGKRRHRRHRRDRFEIGGMPVWALITSVAAVAVVAAGVVIANLGGGSTATANPEPERTARTNFSFGKPAAPHALWLGDSFTEASQVSEPERFPTIVSQYFGWTMQNAGEGGTGYVTDGPPEFPEREPLLGHVDRAIAAEPDILFVSGGLNDTARGYSEDQIRAAVQSTLQPLATGLPDTQIYVIGPFWPRGGAIPEARVVRDIVQQEAQALGFPFFDPIAGDWINMDPALIGPDGTHPSSAGQATIAQRMIEGLTGLGVAPVAP